MNVLPVKTNIVMVKKKMSNECNHPSILFFVEDLTFRCMKCNNKLIKLSGEKEFRIFCELSGKDPKSLMV